MNTELNAFITEVCKLTQLQKKELLTEKNIHCINFLLDISLQKDSNLQVSWKSILPCLSKLDYYFGYY